MLFLLFRNEPASLRPVRAQLPPRLPLAERFRPGRHLPPRRVPLEAGPGRALTWQLTPARPSAGVGGVLP